MKLETSKTLKEIAEIINAEFVGNENHQITGINEIHMVEPGDIVFVDHPKYYDKALKSAATTILMNKKVDCPEGKALLISEDPFRDFNFLNKKFRPFYPWTETISKTSKISPYAVVQPGAVIGNNVTIGKNSFIHSNVVIYDNTVIGDNVIIHANTTIGGDAFYFQKRGNGYNKMYSCGRVIIKDNVEVGANCTIDKGVTGDTIIGEGTKLDCQVHVGHDVVIGKDCLFAAHVGIAGCVTVEDNVTLWGQVGVVSDVKIGKGAVVFGQSGVGKSLEGGKSYFGSPADESRRKFKEIAMLKILPKVIGKLED